MYVYMYMYMYVYMYMYMCMYMCMCMHRHVCRYLTAAGKAAAEAALTAERSRSAELEAALRVSLGRGHRACVEPRVVMPRWMKCLCVSLRGATCVPPVPYLMGSPNVAASRPYAHARRPPCTAAS
jgi:hypothetical protein